MQALEYDILSHRGRLIMLENRVAARVGRDIDDLVKRLVKELKAILKKRSQTHSDRADAVRIMVVLQTVRPAIAKGLAALAASIAPDVTALATREVIRVAASLSASAAAPTTAALRMQLSGISETQLQSALTTEVPQLFSAKARQAAVTRFTTKLQRSLTDNIARGWDVDKLAKVISKDAASILKADAQTLARTAIMQAANNAAIKSYNRNKSVEYVRWSAAFDRRTCAKCGALNGRVYDKRNAPPMPNHPRCRCTWIPVLSGSRTKPDVYRKTDARLSGDADGKFEKWLGNQPEDVQVAFFGSQHKRDLWNTGRIGISDLVSPDGSIRTNAEIDRLLKRRGKG